MSDLRIAYQPINPDPAAFMSPQMQIASVRVQGVDSPEQEAQIFEALKAQITQFFDGCHRQHVLANRGHSFFETILDGTRLVYVNDANQPMVYVTPPPPEAPEPADPRPLGKFRYRAPVQCYRKEYTIARALGRFREMLPFYGGLFNVSNQTHMSFTSAPSDAGYNGWLQTLGNNLRFEQGLFEEFIVTSQSQNGVIWLVRRWFRSWTYPAELGPDHWETLTPGFPTGEHTGIIGAINPATAKSSTIPVWQDIAPSGYLRFTPLTFDNAYSEGPLELIDCGFSPETEMRTDGTFVLPGDPDWEPLPVAII